MPNKLRKVAIIVLGESIDFGLRLEILVLGWKCARKGQKQKSVLKPCMYAITQKNGHGIERLGKQRKRKF